MKSLLNASQTYILLVIALLFLGGCQSIDVRGQYVDTDAVEKIKEAWKKVRDNKKISGLIGLDAYEGGRIIGDKLPENIKTDTLFDLSYNKGITGDKKLVYRTELTKRYPYPIYEGEKYVGLAYKYYKLDQEYELSLMNEILCIVEYMEDGSSLNMFKQYMKNPKGFAFYRIENIINNFYYYGIHSTDNLNDGYMGSGRGLKRA